MNVSDALDGTLMHTSRGFAIVLGAAMLLSGGQAIFAQPLLQQEENQAEEPAVLDPEETQRRELARRRAELEEEKRIELQRDLMRMQGEQMRADQEEIRRRDVMMRYALIIAVGVIVTTLLIAYARSRVGGSGKGTGEG